MCRCTFQVLKESRNSKTNSPQLAHSNSIGRRCSEFLSFNGKCSIRLNPSSITRWLQFRHRRSFPNRTGYCNRWSFTMYMSYVYTNFFKTIGGGTTESNQINWCRRFGTPNRPCFWPLNQRSRTARVDECIDTNIADQISVYGCCRRSGFSVHFYGQHSIALWFVVLVTNVHPLSVENVQSVSTVPVLSDPAVAVPTFLVDSQQNVQLI